MATRKTNIDIEYDEPQQEATLGAVESNDPYESQDPADWVPPMTVRIYPISRPRSKLLAVVVVVVTVLINGTTPNSPPLLKSND